MVGSRATPRVPPRSPALVALLTLLGGVLAGLLLSVGSAAASAAPVGKCRLSELREQVLGADVVLLGQVTSIDSTGGSGGGTVQYSYVVRVLEVLTGDDPTSRRISVVHVPQDDEELEQLEPRERYVFALTGQVDDYTATGCGGVVGESSLDQVNAVIDRASEEPSEPPAERTFTLDEVTDDTEPRSLGQSLAPGAAVALLGALGLVALHRASRRTG